MTRNLVVFIHGRSQEHKDAVALKAEWVSALSKGLSTSNLTLPIMDKEIRFPYYGQTLYDLVKGIPQDQVADVIVRGEAEDALLRAFLQSVLEEVRQRASISDEQIAEIVGTEVIERGILNHEWMQGVLRAIDRYVPGGSGASIAIATKDVYQYLTNPGIRDGIEEGISSALIPGVPTVIVSHSLGTVVAYNLLRRDGERLGWIVPLLVTLGSPLAVTAIKKALRPISHPTCVKKWFNALDERDVVALYALDSPHFAVAPPIENFSGVRNQTTNRHGISGYLSDRRVARIVYDGLVR